MPWIFRKALCCRYTTTPTCVNESGFPFKNMYTFLLPALLFLSDKNSTLIKYLEMTSVCVQWTGKMTWCSVHLILRLPYYVFRDMPSSDCMAWPHPSYMLGSCDTVKFCDSEIVYTSISISTEQHKYTEIPLFIIGQPGNPRFYNR